MSRKAALHQAEPCKSQGLGQTVLWNNFKNAQKIEKLVFGSVQHAPLLDQESTQRATPQEKRAEASFPEEKTEATLPGIFLNIL